MTIVLTIAGIAAPSLLLVAAVRRWVEPVPRRFALLFLGMTFAFLHGAVFTSQLPVPVDEVARGYPYKGVVGEVTPRNPLTNDTVKLFLPWMEVAREELFALRPPLWNRYSFSGYPLLGNGESAPFSPFFLATLFVPLPKQIVAMAGLKIFTALLFGFLFAKRCETSDAAACFAATAFAFSVFQTVFLYYSTTAVTALLPAALYALFRGGMGLIALVVASLLANGHPESVLHIAIASAGLLLINLLCAADKRDWLRRFRFPVYGTLLGLALSAPTWVPVLQQVFLSTRYAELQRAGGHASMYPLTALWAMVSPNGFGNPVRHNWSWILNYSSVAGSYVGLLVLLLFATAAVSRRTSSRDRLWIAFAVLLWLIAMQWSPIGELLNRVPPFHIAANDKLRFAALFIAAIVAARCADRLHKERSLPLFAIAAVLCGLALYVYRLRTALLQPVDLAPVVLVLLFVFVRRPMVAFVVTAAELFLLNGGFNALVDARYYKPRLPILEELHRIAPRQPYRVTGLDWMFLPNASAQYGVEDIRGSDPMSFVAYTSRLLEIAHDEPGIDFDRVHNADHRLLDLLNVRFLLAEPGVALSGRWQQRYDGPDGVLYENASALERFFVREGDGDVRVVQASPLRFVVRVEARTPVVVASSQPAAPGWRIGGAEGLRHEGIFLAFGVPAGRHTVVVAYRPRTFYGTLPLAFLAALILLWNSTRGRGVVGGPQTGEDP